MELEPQNLDKMKKVAIAAATLVVGGAVVKYVNKDKLSGYVYYFEKSRSVFIGLLRPKDQSPIQFTGELVDSSDGIDFLPDDSANTPEVVENIGDFEKLFTSTDS